MKVETMVKALGPMTAFKEEIYHSEGSRRLLPLGRSQSFKPF